MTTICYGRSLTLSEQQFVLLAEFRIHPSGQPQQNAAARGYQDDDVRLGDGVTRPTPERHNCGGDTLSGRTAGLLKWRRTRYSKALSCIRIQRVWRADR